MLFVWGWQMLCFFAIFRKLYKVSHENYIIHNFISMQLIAKKEKIVFNIGGFKMCKWSVQVIKSLHKMILVRTQKHFQFFRNADSFPLCRVAAAIMWFYHLLRQVQWVTIFSWQTYLEKSILKKSKSHFEGILEWLNLYLPFFMGDTEYWVNFHCGIIGYNWVIKWIKDSISILLWINIVRVCPTQYGLRGDFWLPNVCRH